LVLSIDVDAHVGRHDRATRQAIHTVAHDLLDQLADARISATWALGDLATEVLAEQIAAREAHELALLADASWAAVGPEAFSAGLVGRLAQARSTGYAPTTLVLHDCALPPSTEVLTRHSISAVREPLSAVQIGGTQATLLGRLVDSLQRPKLASDQPRTLCWGVRELRSTLSVPASGVGLARRTIDRAIDGASVVHVALDLPKLAAGRGARPIMKLLRHIVRQQNAGGLEVVTITGLVARVSDAQQARPTKSILRRAA
jgi:hypothetical protein